MDERNFKLSDDDAILSNKKFELAPNQWKVRVTTRKGAILIIDGDSDEIRVDSNFKIEDTGTQLIIHYELPNTNFVDPTKQ